MNNLSCCSELLVVQGNLEDLFESKLICFSHIIYQIA